MLAEHEARNGERRLGLRASKPVEPVALGALQDHLDAGEAEPLRTPEELRVVRARQHVRHHAGQPRHSVTGAPFASAERHAASVSSSDSRLWRAELYGSRSSAIAREQLGHRSREALRVPRTLELERRDLAVAIELQEVRAEQDAAADRALGAVDPERRAATRGARVADRADEDVRAARVADLDVRAPGIACVVGLARHSVVGRAHLDRPVAVEPAAADVDPVDVVVVDHEVVELVEVEADDRRHVLVVEVRDGDDVADGALLHEQGGGAERRAPAAVLVHGQLHACPLGRLDHAACRLEVEGERLLGEHVLARRDRLRG